MTTDKRDRQSNGEREMGETEIEIAWEREGDRDGSWGETQIRDIEM